MKDDERLAAEMAAARALARDVGILPTDPEPEPGQRRRDAEILAWVLAHPPNEPVRPGAAQRWRRLLLAGAAVMALLAVVSVPLGWWSSPAAASGTPRMLDYTTPPAAVVDGTAPTAADVLRDLVDRAQRRNEVSGDGDIQHIASSNWFAQMQARDDGSLDAVIYPTYFESWTGPDGSVVTRERRGPALDVKGRLTDEPDWGAAGVGGDALPPGSADTSLVSILPREIGALRDALLDRLSMMDCTIDPSRQSWCLASEIGTLSGDFIIPADLTAAMWKVLGEEPGMSYLGTVTDRAGRQAVAIAAPPLPDLGYTQVQVLLIDPETGELLGAEQVDIHNPELGISEPMVTGFTCYTARQWVDAIPPDPVPIGAATS